MVFKKDYKLKRGKYRKMLGYKRKTMRALMGRPSLPPGVRRSTYRRKGRRAALIAARPQVMSKSVARFFRVPPKELSAALRSTNVFLRLDEAGGTGNTKGIGVVQINPTPIEGKQFVVTNQAANTASTAKCFGVSSYFNAYTYCICHAIKIKAQAFNHSSTNTVTCVIVPLLRTTDLWSGADINTLVTKPEAKSFLMTPRGSANEKKNMKIMLRLKDFTDYPAATFRFDERGKASTAEAANDAVMPFIYGIYFLACPLKNSDQARIQLLVDCKIVVKYYCRFSELKAVNAF